jgi:two-component system, OmpR family, phosphate regulon sensor histidine kinase PhoR
VASPRPIRRRLHRLVLLMGFFMLAIAVPTAVVLQVQVRSTTMITTVVAPAYDANRQALQAMSDGETGLRGYQLSGGEPSLLEPYGKGEQRTGAALRTVRALLERAEKGRRDRATVLAAQAAQEKAAAEWWAYARRSVQDYRPGDDPGVDRGKPLFDAFRAANTAVGQRLQAQRNAGRTATVDNLNLDTVVVLLTALLAMLLAAFVGRRMTRALTRPLQGLHGVVTRQNKGERDLRAREDQQITEIRDLAADFNRLLENNQALHLEQAHGLMMHQLSLDVERALRRAADVQGALDVLCAVLGEGLGVDRVMANTVDGQHRVLRGAQWHVSSLAPLGDVPDDLSPHVGQLAEQLWSAAGRLAIHDFLDPEVQAQERARIFTAETRARSVIMVPIGLGDRVLGVIFVLAVHEPRRWTRAEANAVQQVAAFAARVLVQAEHEANQQDHVERLERLDRQKTDFLSTVSHELRTPLTSISGYLELLQDGDAGELTAGQRSMLGVIDRNSTRLRGLIEDLLVLNRIESGGLHVERHDVDLGQLVQHTVEELSPLARRGRVQIEVRDCGNGVVVSGDQGHLHRAIVNVMSNAIKFTPAEGRVELSLEVLLDEQGPDGPWVRLRCRDSGIGIPAADMPQLFSRFYRAANATTAAIPGTGLGLAIVKTIVEDHGGRLDLTSVEGEGTVVVIDLPLVRAALPAGMSTGPGVFSPSLLHLAD